MVYGDENLRPYNYDWMFKPRAMRRISEYENAVDPWVYIVVKPGSSRAQLRTRKLVESSPPRKFTRPLCA